MGKVIFSYDCESMWGMLDGLDRLSSKDFSRAKIIDTYEKVYGLHEQYKIPGTFAFVGAFTLPRQKFESFKNSNLLVGTSISDWLSNLNISPEKFSAVDWFIPELVDMLKMSSFDYEIATHGFTHVDLSKCTATDLRFEMDGIKMWERHHKIAAETIIFPRNKINLDLLKIMPSLKGFRQPPKNKFSTGSLKRMVSLAKELYPFPESEQIVFGDLATKLPGDFFINWRRGARKLVPTGITISRAVHAMQHAADTGGTVNFWLHPHNLITGSKGFDLLERILEEVSKMDQLGKIDTVTQTEVC